MDTKIPDWKLERLVLGELPQAELATLRQAVEQSAELQERLAALEADNARILREHPAPVVAAQVRARAVSLSRPRFTRWSLMLAPALAAASVLVVVSRSSDELTHPGESLEVTRNK